VYVNCRAEKADYFLKKIIDAHDYIESNGSASQNVKVALIDTGVQLHENVRHMYGSKLRECRSWLPSCDDPAGVTKPDGADEDGHGTHCTSALLKCIPEDCEVYVAQVFGGYVDSVPAVSYSNQNATHVAQVCCISFRSIHSGQRFPQLTTLSGHRLCCRYLEGQYHIHVVWLRNAG
jgi:subtilisin family serine protease